MGAIKSADILENESLTASGRQLPAGDGRDSFADQTGRVSPVVLLDKVHSESSAKDDNAAVSALQQSLYALVHQRDRADQELQTMLKRRELLLSQIDRCAREISEIVQAIRKLRTLD
jgi:hypothetical protein